MIARVALTIALATGLFAAPFAAEAQQAGKVYRIGLLSTSFAQRTAGVQAFKDSGWRGQKRSAACVCG